MVVAVCVSGVCLITYSCCPHLLPAIQIHSHYKPALRNHQSSASCLCSLCRHLQQKAHKFTRPLLYTIIHWLVLQLDELFFKHEYMSSLRHLFWLATKQSVRHCSPSIKSLLLCSRAHWKNSWRLFHPATIFPLLIMLLLLAALASSARSCEKLKWLQQQAEQQVLWCPKDLWIRYVFNQEEDKKTPCPAPGHPHGRILRSV